MANTNDTTCVIDNVPDEILEYILSYLPPYDDLDQCRLVSKRWQRCVFNVVRTSMNEFRRAVINFNTKWNEVLPAQTDIAKRYSHSACVHKNSMYIFGGITSHLTTFNDLWRLDLSSRRWVRPLTMGTYPSPKACASMVCHGDSLVLLGGWSLPSRTPLHQLWQLFDELHIYSITNNRWMRIARDRDAPPPIAGHSVSVHGDRMIVFGGLTGQQTIVQHTTCNTVWCFNLVTLTWSRPRVSSVQPPSRFGHTQAALDDGHLLIFGGCGGPNSTFHDVWLLDMTCDPWQWKNIPVKNKQWAPTQVRCKPACHVNNHIIFLGGRNSDSVLNSPSYTAKWNFPPQMRYGDVRRPEDDANLDIAPPHVRGFAENGVEIIDNVMLPQRKPTAQSTGNSSVQSNDRDVNVNGKRGRFVNKNGNKTYENRDADDPTPSTSKEADKVPYNAQVSPRSHMTARPSPLSIARPQHQKMCAFSNDKSASRGRHLATINRMEQFLRNQKASLAVNKSKTEKRADSKPTCATKRTLGLFVLDISHALNDDGYVQWLEWEENSACDGPDERILYTLVPGKAELIMFGGMQLAEIELIGLGVDPAVTNSLHFITARKVLL